MMLSSMKSIKIVQIAWFNNFFINAFNGDWDGQI